MERKSVKEEIPKTKEKIRTSEKRYLLKRRKRSHGAHRGHGKKSSKRDAGKYRIRKKD